MQYDVVIIGAGLGGLTAGAKLAREGKKVLVIEQHDRPGGYATTFQRGDFLMEVGLHEMDGPAPGDIKTKIFNDLDVFNHVGIIRLPEFYRFVNGRVDVTLPHDRRVAEERLTALFPGEAGGIRAYFDQIMRPGGSSSGMPAGDISTGEFLDSIIRDEDLKLVLLGNLGYFHDDPYTLSLAYYSIAQGSYYAGGASYIRGGSQQLSDYLANFIRQHGGEVLLNHLVTGIRIENHRATGVCFKKRKDRSDTLREVAAGDIVANSAMPNVVELLPEAYGNLLRNEISDQKTGASLLSLYLGFSRPVRELGHCHYSTSVFDSSVRSQKEMAGNNREDYTKRNFVFADYSQVDAGLAPPGKSTGAVCCIDYADHWEGLSRKAYLSEKARVATLLVERLDRLIPGIKGLVAHTEVGTPLTLRRYTLNPGGSVYGFAQLPSRRFPKWPELPGNLHFASAWGKTGGGFSGALYGGYLCALQVLRRR